MYRVVQAGTRFPNLPLRRSECRCSLPAAAAAFVVALFLRSSLYLRRDGEVEIGQRRASERASESERTGGKGRERFPETRRRRRLRAREAEGTRYSAPVPLWPTVFATSPSLRLGTVDARSIITRLPPSFSLQPFFPSSSSPLLLYSRYPPPPTSTTSSPRPPHRGPRSLSAPRSRPSRQPSVHSQLQHDERDTGTRGPASRE